ncbi:MAG: threonine--tRNA ligase [Candidatus Falkowbacteria bacterium]|nr:threonine--tRNA ligase [Candidatus Falkowbacteria bacterium]
MIPLTTKRHSLAHVMAHAVQELWPKAKFAIGPDIDTGWYYDIDFGNEKIVEEDFKKIEKKMQELVRKDLPFEKIEVSIAEALKWAKENDQPYKIEIIEELRDQGETKVSFYTVGEFKDLCRGPHVESTKQIGLNGFKLHKLAGAYWRGDEKNKMLTRIYGLSFENKEALDEYILMLAEAEKRDHRKLGKELSIFAFDEDVGPGLPLWLPNGTVLIDELEKLAKETETEANYLRVRTPHIAKESMYKKSGHLPYYEESMFPPMEMDGEKYYLKAMNCPHHHKIFENLHVSYRDLPIRLAEYGTVYRYEQSGELFGLMRVRSLQMNDAHIYCSKEQFASEFRAVNEMYLKYFKIFGIDKYVMRFSTHAAEKLGKKYVDNAPLWKETEDMVRQVLIDSNIPYVEIPDEAAFYGPKIDVQVWSAIGREFTLATNQVDFAVPERFGLQYKASGGDFATPICIHRAPLGTHERFIGFLIEHYAGSFPLWLSPVQVKLLSVAETHNEFCHKLAAELKAQDIRVIVDASNETVGNKIRKAANEKVPYMLVIGDKEMNSDKLFVRERGEQEAKEWSKEDFLKTILEKIKDRK